MDITEREVTLKFKPSDFAKLEEDITETLGDDYLVEDSLEKVVEFVYRHLNDNDSAHFLQWRYQNGSW